MSTQIEATEGVQIGWVARLETGRIRKARGVRFAGALAAVLGVLAIWYGVTAAGWWSEIILPPPSKVWSAFIDSVTVHDGRTGLSDAYLWEHVWASLWRILRGVFWGAVLGAPVGLALGLSRSFEAIAEPLVSFLRSLPPLGYFSLLIIWFGIGDTSKVWLLFIAAFPPIAVNVAAGVGSLRAERINAGLSLGANHWQLIHRILLPSVLPDFLTGIRVAIGFAWTTIVAAETSNGLPGIGGLAWATKKELRADIAILCVIVIGIVAVAMDFIIRFLERKLVPWTGRS